MLNGIKTYTAQLYLEQSFKRACKMTTQEILKLLLSYDVNEHKT